MFLKTTSGRSGQDCCPDLPKILFAHNVLNRKRKHWHYVQCRRYVKARNKSATIVNVERNFCFLRQQPLSHLRRRNVFFKTFRKEGSIKQRFFSIYYEEIFAETSSRFSQFGRFCFVTFEELTLSGAKKQLFFSIYYEEIFLKTFIRIP